MGVRGHRLEHFSTCWVPGVPAPASAVIHVLLFSEGVTKLTNKAALWYVPLSLEDVDRVLEVPPVVVRSPSRSPLGGSLVPL